MVWDKTRWRREWDSNPRYRKPVQRFSRPSPSTARPSLPYQSILYPQRFPALGHKLQRPPVQALSRYGAGGSRWVTPGLVPCPRHCPSPFIACGPATASSRGTAFSQRQALGEEDHPETARGCRLELRGPSRAEITARQLLLPRRLPNGPKRPRSSWRLPPSLRGVPTGRPPRPLSRYRRGCRRRPGTAPPVGPPNGSGSSYAAA